MLAGREPVRDGFYLVGIEPEYVALHRSERQFLHDSGRLKPGHFTPGRHVGTVLIVAGGAARLI